MSAEILYENRKDPIFLKDLHIDGERNAICLNTPDIFSKNEHETFILYKEDIDILIRNIRKKAVGIWGPDFTEYNPGTKGAQYTSYMDRRFMCHNFLKITVFDGYITLDIVRGTRTMPYFYKFNRKRCGRFLYDLKQLSL